MLLIGLYILELQVGYPHSGRFWLGCVSLSFVYLHLDQSLRLWVSSGGGHYILLNLRRLDRLLYKLLLVDRFSCLARIGLIMLARLLVWSTSPASRCSVLSINIVDCLGLLMTL